MNHKETLQIPTIKRATTAYGEKDRIDLHCSGKLVIISPFLE